MDKITPSSILTKNGLYLYVFVFVITGIDFFVGLPLEENHRVARHIELPMLQILIDNIMEPNYRNIIIKAILFGNTTISSMITDNPADFNQVIW